MVRLVIATSVSRRGVRLRVSNACRPAHLAPAAFSADEIRNHRAIHTTGALARRELGSMKHFSIDSHWDAIKGQLKERYS
ncbi:MAG: hypothetical protein ABI318_23730, partial [Chthoniobacteraceae bacterium]